MFSKRSDRRAQGRLSGRALGLTLLALALSGSAFAAGTRGVAAGQMPLGGAAGNGTPVTTTPTAAPAPATQPSSASSGHAPARADTSGQKPALSAVTSIASAAATAPASRLRAPAGAAAAAPASGSAGSLNLDGVRVPPVEAMSPVTGLNFKSGLELGPVLLVADLLGLAALALLVRRRWLRPAD